MIDSDGANLSEEKNEEGDAGVRYRPNTGAN